MSILDHVREIGSLVMATTHYPELKHIVIIVKVS